MMMRRFRHSDTGGAVLRGANTEGDSNSIDWIAAAFAGAGLGSKGVPAGWIQRIEKSTTLGALATRLAAKRGAQ